MIVPLEAQIALSLVLWSMTALWTNITVKSFGRCKQ